MIARQVLSLEADGLLAHALRGLVEKSQHDLFAVHRRYRRNTKVERVALDLHEGLAVLRNLMLGNVHAAHDLEARDDGALQFGGGRKHAAQKTVDTHTHDHFAVLRLQVDIARALGKRAFNEAVDKADRRRAVAGVHRLL